MIKLQTKCHLDLGAIYIGKRYATGGECDFQHPGACRPYERRQSGVHSRKTVGGMVVNWQYSDRVGSGVEKTPWRFPPSRGNDGQYRDDHKALAGTPFD